MWIVRDCRETLCTAAAEDLELVMGADIAVADEKRLPLFCPRCLREQRGPRRDRGHRCPERMGSGGGWEAGVGGRSAPRWPLGRTGVRRREPA